MRTACIALAIAVAPALADEFTIDPGTSSILGSASLTIATDGSLIGDYDADTNPTGTQTRAGLFGGSGNNPIPVSIDVVSDTTFDLGPSGSFTLDADTGSLTFTVDAFSADMLNGQTVASTIGATFLYDTFHTVDPGMLYPGGIPLPIDLGAAEFTTYTIEQTGPMDPPGVLIDNGDGTYTLAGQIPVATTIVGSVFGNPVEPGPTETVLPIAGTLTPMPGGATVTIEVDLGDLSQDFDTSTLPPLPDIPFELPTLGTDTAGVILTLSISSAGLEASGAISLVANGVAGGCNAADLAEPFGVLDLADLTAFITGFLAQDPSADLAPPAGTFDLADVQAFVTAFVGGCP
ncbi:MAG: hypothetical protein H6810_07860 [Phycisphaeraceae bacterium]|nr:MAG: hypothetical protein H6810_07860 [Phycisphaeraceae bacterium]